jgi:hypothetical protein
MDTKFPLTDEQVLAHYHGDETIANDNHEALYEYYTSQERGDDAMPYGTAKARAGDPYQWISNRLDARACELSTGMKGIGDYLNHQVDTLKDFDATHPVAIPSRESVNKVDAILGKMIR